MARTIWQSQNNSHGRVYTGNQFIDLLIAFLIPVECFVPSNHRRFRLITKLRNRLYLLHGYLILNFNVFFCKLHIAAAFIWTRMDNVVHNHSRISIDHWKGSIRD